MPMKINVGLNKKIGLPDFGSLGATCSVEFEADHGLLESDLDGFHQRVKNAFTACRQAVQDALTRQQQAQSAGSPAPSSQARSAIPAGPNTAPENRHDNRHGNGAGANGHEASEKQHAYIRQLAGQIKGLGVRKLDTVSQKMFGKPLAAISSFEASGLIDALKSVKAGEMDLNTVLGGAAP